MKGDASLKEAIEEYKNIYLAYRNFAERTREEYVNDLEDMARFLGQMGKDKVSEVRLPDLMRYLAELEKRGFAGSTRKRKTISIRSFFGFLYLDGVTMTDLGKQIIVPYVEARKPRYLTTEEYTRLLQCAMTNKRDYAIVQLFLQTGITLSELTSLTLSDLGITDGSDEKGNRVEYIRVVSNQRNQSRVIPLNPRAGVAINDYLAIREESSSNNLFLSRSGEQLGERGVEKIVGKYIKLSGINNASVNSLRHTFGTHYAVKGTSKKTIQKVMGHRDSRTTSIYYSIADDIHLSDMISNSV